jgi:membrane peptidoglycan carboxypeptidase
MAGPGSSRCRFLKVEDRNGKVLYQHKQVQGKRVLDEGVAFLINHILSDNSARSITFGANSFLNMGGRPVAVKTGTTNDQRDNWAIGWSNSAIVGVWVGNNDNSPMKAVASGASGASPDLAQADPGSTD